MYIEFCFILGSHVIKQCFRKCCFVAQCLPSGSELEVLLLGLRPLMILTECNCELCPQP